MSNPIHAALSVTGATGAIIANKNFLSVVGGTAGATPGIYVCTLAAGMGVAAASCAIVATKRGAAAAADGTFSIAHTSDTVKEVTFTAAGVAADVDFDLVMVNLTDAA